MLAINNHENSNYTSCFVYFLNTNKNVDLLEEAEKSIKDISFKKDHLQVLAIKWLSEKRLKFEVKGYDGTGANDVDCYLQYEIGKKVSVTSK